MVADTDDNDDNDDNDLQLTGDYSVDDSKFSPHALGTPDGQTTSSQAVASTRSPNSPIAALRRRLDSGGSFFSC